MVKISIIIPVYNCETYLEQCIDSVCCQTLSELEIICVDDGSTDYSSDIIRRLQTNDKRIVLYRQKNQGSGVARNMGIRNAKGKYIAFLDSDDYYLDKNALASMFNICEAKKVVACGSLRKHIKNGTVENESLFQGTASDNIPCGMILDYQDFQLDYNYQSFLFLKRHLTENVIYFPDYRRFQDPPFLVRALYEAGRFYVADIYLYCYRLSDMEQRFDQPKTCDLLHGLIDNLQFAQEHKLDILFNNTARRLEDEYVDIVCKNISPESLDVLKLLMKANKLICDYYENMSYVIQPLRTLQFAINQYTDRKDLLRLVEKQKEIVVYGAGKYGRVFFKFLKRNNLHRMVSSFVVSDLKGNEAQIEGVPVITFHELLKGEEKPLFVTVRGSILREVRKNLTENGYKNYKIIKEELLHVIAVEEDK